MRRSPPPERRRQAQGSDTTKKKGKVQSVLGTASGAEVLLADTDIPDAYGLHEDAKAQHLRQACREGNGAQAADHNKRREKVFKYFMDLHAARFHEDAIEG